MRGAWDEWVGRTRRVEDHVSLQAARMLAATLDQDPESLRAGDPLPLGWHWTHFNGSAARSRLAEDGHEARGAFLPPVPLARRMWAGGRLRFHRPLEIGGHVARISTIERVSEKEGRSGPLVFVTVGHRFEDGSGLLLEEEQDLVYREPPRGAREPEPVRHPPADAELVGGFAADEVTLFRFSALTFNGHRIHYDHPYATGREGYPGLVVHGPLIALLLLEHGARLLPGPRSYRYRAVAPLFANEGFTLSARTSTAGEVALWAAHPERGVAMEAWAE